MTSFISNWEAVLSILIFFSSSWYPLVLLVPSGYEPISQILFAFLREINREMRNQGNHHWHFLFFLFTNKNRPITSKKALHKRKKKKKSFRQFFHHNFFQLIELLYFIMTRNSFPCTKPEDIFIRVSISQHWEGAEENNCWVTQPCVQPLLSTWDITHPLASAVNSLTRRRRYIYLFNLILNEKAQDFYQTKDTVQMRNGPEQWHQ